METLDDIKKLKSLDNSDMLRILHDFPIQCKEATTLMPESNIAPEYRNFSNIVFSGLGGSAITGDVVKSILIDELTVPVVINRNYTLPGFVSEDTLVFILSYSGNTEETLSAYNQAKEKGAKIVAISSGGKLISLARDDGIPFTIIPSNFPPRGALGYLLFAALNILFKLGAVNNKQQYIDEMVTVLENLRENQLKPGVKTENNIAKKIASDLFGKFSVIYASSDHLEAVALRWRGQLAENSKCLSSSHLFPEMNHNEIVGWEHPKDLLSKFIVIFLKDKDDHLRTKKRMDITKSIITEQNIPVLEISSKGEGLLARVMSLIYIGDFVSFYLAVLNNTDPTPVDKITYLKGELAKL